MMKTSPKGIAFIAAFEGCILSAYRDVAGVLTIGVGHTKAAGPPDVKPGMTITREAAYAILAADLAQVEARVREVFTGIAIDQPTFDASVSFDFNTGAINRATWVTKLKQGHKGEIGHWLAQWNKASGREVAGLVRRRAAEAKLIETGDYGQLAAPSGNLSGGEKRT